MSAACRSVRFAASAGTGKTHQVVNLYIALILGRPFPGADDDLPGVARGGIFDGSARVPPEHLLMVTFTRNAAAEMRARITEALEQELARCDAGEAPLYWSLLRRLSGAVISTIHAFAQQLVSRHALPLGLSPAGRVLEQDEADDLLDVAARDALRECLRDRDAAWVNDLERLGEGLGVNRLRAGLPVLVRQCALRGIDLTRCRPEDLATPAVSPSLADLERVREHMGSSGVRAGKVVARVAEALERAIAGLGPQSAADAVVRAAETVAEACRGAWGRGPEAAALKRTVEAALAGIAGYPARREAARLLVSFLRLGRCCAGAYEQAKREQGALDFDDLLLKARDPVRADPNAIPPLAAIVVDEAQDNSFVQNELLRCVREASGAALVVCGDRKQSIYGWRGAEPDGLDALAKERGLDTVPLRTSYRSQAALLEWLNDFFGRDVLGPERYGEADRLTPCAAAAGTRGPNVEVLLPDWEAVPDPSQRIVLSGADGSPGDEPQTKARVELTRGDLARLAEAGLGGVEWQGASAESQTAEAQEARAFARRIRLLTSPEAPRDWRPAWVWDPGAGGWVRAARARHRFRDVLILLRATTRQELYESALKEEGIPFTTDGKGRGFFFRQEVLDVVNLLSALAFPGDEAAWIGLLRSPFCGLSDAAIAVLRDPSTRSAPECPAGAGHSVHAGQARWAAPCVFDPADPTGTAVVERMAAAGLAEEAEAVRGAGALLTRLRRVAGRLGAAELVREAVALTGYDAMLAGLFHGVQRLANLQKLLTWIQARERLETLDLQGVARALRLRVEQGQTEPDAAVLDPMDDAVRINTVHAAKGLSSPVVFVPDLRRIPLAESDWILVGPDGVGGRWRLAGQGDEPADIETPDFAGRKEAVSRLRAEESRRLFYVACTRARDLLVFSGENPNRRRGDELWRGWINRHFSRVGLPAPGVRLRAYGAVQEAWRKHRVQPRLPGGVPAPAVLAAAEERLVRPSRAERFRFPATVIAGVPEAVVAPPGSAATDRRPLEREYLLTRVTGLAPVRVKPRREDERESAEAILEPLDAAAVGTLAHRVLESLDFWGPRPVADQVRAAPELNALRPAERRAAGERLAHVAERVAAMLGDVPAGDVIREMPFCSRFDSDGARVLVDGKVDLLFLGDGAWHLVDYKFSDLADEDLRHAYGFQLALYREAVSAAERDSDRRRPLFRGPADPAEFRLQILAVRSDGDCRAIPVDADRFPDVPRRVVGAARFLEVRVGAS
jgi:ATP-dependent exoDNAse (exonuclease V) beta subunit